MPSEAAENEAHERDTLHASSKPLVYVAGPYRAATSEGVRFNVDRAVSVAKHLLVLGYSALCPHTMMDGWQRDDELTDTHFLANGLELLRRCDAVFVFAVGIWREGYWVVSEGTVAEAEEAARRGIPIVHSVEELNTICGKPQGG